MVSTFPLEPSDSPILFPDLIRPLLNVNASEKTPEMLLYVIHPDPERALSPILLLKVFQSVDERAPVVVELAVRIPNTPDTLL